jgi:hypothetical protein
MANTPVKSKETPEKLASTAVNNPSFVPTLISSLAAKDSSKYAYAKALSLLSANYPNLLYPHFDYFVSLLNSRYKILKWNAILILANLIIIDVEHKFDGVFDEYYHHLWDGDLITAANIVGASGKIAVARPDLRDKITSEILKVDVIPLPTTECREIARGKALLTFKEYSANLDENKLVNEFIQHCLQSRRPATRKKAEGLLKKVPGK